MNRQVEILVIGAGPAGMAAATAAASCGKSVIVLDDNPAAGGQIWREGVASAHNTVDRQRERAVAAFRGSGAVLLNGRSVIDASSPHTIRTMTDVNSGQAAESFIWQRLILATGARERLLPFPGWTLPGVFGAGGLQALVKGGYSVAGKRVVVAGTGPLLLAVAAHLKEYGAEIRCIAEQASLSQLLPFAASLIRTPGKLLQGAGFRSTLAGSPYKLGCWPIEVKKVDSSLIVRLTNGSRSWSEECDLLACGFHLVPNLEVASLLGCKLDGAFVAVNRQQRTSVEDVFCAGEPTGVAGLDAAIVEGEIAGLCAAGETGKAASLYSRRDRERSFGERLNSAFRLRSALQRLPNDETIVCRCEDVTFARLKDYPSWTEAKLQTRCGMGPCQGRICGPATATLFGWQAASVRPPLFPTPIATFGKNETSIPTESNILQEIL
jgi:NADPH-dependent 2,4-dienoyl-CoA reductase/sulfur reductase-like enzyme